jgi:hypothetical protein
LELPAPWGTVPVSVNITYAAAGISVSVTGDGISQTFLMPPRYRREYDDYTLTENADFDVELTGPDGLKVDVTFNLAFEPSCRLPDSAIFCGNCFSPELYNVIDLFSRDKYPLANPFPEGCSGVPIDIDVVCGRPYGESDRNGNEPIAGGVTMYLGANGIVPVIDSIAYDVISLPTAPAGKINVFKIITLSTRDEIRDWTCRHLRFATPKVGLFPPTSGGSPTGGSSSSGGVLSVDRTVDETLTFNWPFNDLYFSQGCPGGDTVNLVPC